MYKFFFSVIIFLNTLDLYQQKLGYFFIWFTDKANNAYSLTKPDSFLSQRALIRRLKYNIPIDSTDLPVSNAYINEIKTTGAIFHSSSKWLNGAIFIVNDTNIYEQIITKTFVKKITYLKPITTSNRKINSIKFETLYNLKNFNYGHPAHQIKMLRGNFLHEKGFTGDNMLIAVLDAGFVGVDTISFFKRLFDNNKILLTRNIVNSNFNNHVYGYHSHGTMVLSIMGGYKENEYIGVAPNASYALIRTEDGDTEYIFEEYCWVVGAELADSIGADIINSSLGYTTFDDSTMNHTWNDLDGRTSVASIAATICARKGMIVVCSAGNWGLQPWRKIGIPADADSILTVGAVDSTGLLAFFSSQGYTADGRVKPTIVAQGLDNWCISAYSGLPTKSSGTSFSAPLIAGLVACLWQAFNDSSNMVIYNAIIKTANKYNNPDSLYGYGLPNFELAYYILNEVNENVFNRIKFFPNPAKDCIYIENLDTDNKKCVIKILDISGRLIYTEHFLDLQGPIYLNKLESGIYFLVFLSENINLRFKFVKL
ncbi:MAG: S8 family serine peptidase [Bacteroidales bacterium]|nr:S8 family serine peptidase [Bacteroidales bacterium]